MDEFDQSILAKFDDVVLEREQMHEYQGVAYNHLLENPYSALFIDMGLGKTVTTATLISDLIDDFALASNEKALIIGPPRVAVETWPTEFRRWRHLAHQSISLIYASDDDPRIPVARAKARLDARERLESSSEIEKAGRSAETACKEGIRRQAAFANSQIHIIPSNWLVWLVDLYQRKWPYRIVVIDESSQFKDIQAERWKALKRVRAAKGYIRRLHELTATPCAESYEHLFAQVYLLDAGERFGPDVGPFREEFFVENKYTRKFKLRPNAKEQIIDKIKDICLLMKAEDYLDLEKPAIVQRVAHMTAPQMALYQKMEKDMIVQLPDDVEIEAETAAALSSRLLQMASGFLYETKFVPGQNPLDEDEHVKVIRTHKIHDHKIDMLKEIVEESQGQPILVGYHFKSSLDRLKKAFPKAVVMDAAGKCVKPWNAGKIPMLLMHPQSGGHGLNLQAGGHHIVFFDIPWSLELFLQFIGRLARQGQKNKVIVQLLTMAGTLDEVVFTALQMKEDAQEEMFKILRRMREKLARLKKKRAVVSTPAPQEKKSKPLPVKEMMERFGMTRMDAEVTHAVEMESWEEEDEF